jgi:hypothetical protein
MPEWGAREPLNDLTMFGMSMAKPIFELRGETGAERSDLRLGATGDPVFIGGMFKSGTSLLRAMLGRHSRLFAGLETQWLAESPQASAPEERRASLERLSIFIGVPCAALEKAVGDAAQVEACLDRLMDFVVRRDGRSRWVEKTPYNAGHIGRILSSWPSAKVLHVARDPRDVYASMVEIGKWTEPAVFAEHWCNTVGAAREWLGAQGGVHPAYQELRHERLVLAPEATIRKVIAFLGETWEPEVARFDGRPQDFERVQRATGKNSSTLKRLAMPLTDSRIGIWRSMIGEERWELAHAELDRRGRGALVTALTVETDAICAEAAEMGYAGLVECSP